MADMWNALVSTGPAGILAVTALAMVILVLAGCGAQAVASHPVSAQPANPVAVVRETGATPSPGEVYGSRDVYGGLYADGNIYGPDCTAADNCSEQVTVYSLQPGQTAQEAMAQSGLVPSDNQAVITTPAAIVCVTPADMLNGGGLTYFVSPAVIAARVHGTVVAPVS